MTREGATALESIERDALDFVQRLQRLYFYERDMEQLLDHMTEDVSWIGTGAQEVCHGLDEARESLEAERREFGGHFLVTASQYEATPIAPQVCLVSGELSARAEEGGDMAEVHVRLSLVCRRTEAGMRLVHLHLSQPDQDQSDGEYYVRRSAQADRRALQAKVAETTQTLAERNRELETLIEYIPGGMHRCGMDPGLTLLSMSQSFLGLCGYSRAEIRERFQDRFIALVYPEDRPGLLRGLGAQCVQGDSLELEYRIVRRDGSLTWVLDKGRVAPGAEGAKCIYSVMVDVTRRKKMEEDLRLSLDRHRIIMDQATDVIFEWDIVQDVLSCSPNWRKKFGYVPIDHDVQERLPRSRNIHPDDLPAVLRMVEEVRAGKPYTESRFRIRTVGGTFLWCRVRATGQRDSTGRPIRAVGVIADVDAEQRREQKLLDQATRDGLTGLLNRNAVKERVERYLAGSGGVHALIILDLDGFKAINDRCGHLCGDAVLTDVAAALRRGSRRGDVLGRIGGDEFLAFLPDIRDRDAAAQKAQELLSAIGQISVEGLVSLSCSIGVAMAPEDGGDYLTLYRNADRALYRVKDTGRGAYALCRGERRGEAPAEPVLSAVNRTIDSDLGEVDQMLSQYAFHILYASVDIRTAIHHLLDIVGRAYDVSRVYIFEDLEGGRRCGNTFEWCNEGVAPEIGNLRDIPYSEGYRDLFNEDGVFYCRDIRALSPEAYATLAPQGIESVLQCAIREDGKMVGFVGFDECRRNRYWTEDQVRSLSLVANVLSTFLVKERQKERLALLEKELRRLQISSK